MFRTATILITALAAATNAAALDVVVLKHGGRVEGEVINGDVINGSQAAADRLVVATAGGGRITLAAEQISEVVQSSDALRWYREALPNMPPTVDGHWIMAEQCRQRGLKPQREFHLQQILELDPDHEGARRGLGYSRVDGRWIQNDNWMRDQGYVRYRGSWRIPQDVAIELAAGESEREEIQWKQKLRMWRSWINRPRGKQQQAIDAIRRIRDWRAAQALAEVVRDESESVDLRLLCIKVLGELRTDEGLNAFIDRAINDPNANVRDACVKELTRYGAAAATAAFQRHLQSKDNKKVNRAAFALGQIGAEEVTLPLIHSLVTEHRFVIVSGQPGQMNLGFGSGPGGGGSGLSAGGSKKVVTQPLRNESSLNALVAIHPGVNFGYDVEKWKEWYIKNHSPLIGSLRRDD